VVPKPTEKPKKTIRVAQTGARKKRAKSRGGILDHIAIPMLIRKRVSESQNFAIMTFNPITVARRISFSFGSHL
jgi:hypothetical protein